jgi:hypothetical protein
MLRTASGCVAVALPVSHGSSPCHYVETTPYGVAVAGESGDDIREE